MGVRRDERSRVEDNDGNDDIGATVWVGNLPTDIQESEILQEYERYGKIKKIDLIGKVDNPDNKPYAFVHFLESSAAKEAMEATNHAPLFGQPFVKVNLRRSQGSVTPSDENRHRSKPDYEIRRPGQAGPEEKGKYRVFVENLPEDMDWKELKQLGAKFANRGVITYAKTNADRTGELEFTSFRDMEVAVQELDQRNFSGSTSKLRAYASSVPQQDKPASRKRQRSPSAPYRDERELRSRTDSSGKPDDRTRIWVGGLPDNIKEDDIERVYKRFGKVLLVDVRKPRPGNCFAFVDYPSYSSAERALETTDQLPLFGMTLLKVAWPSRERPEPNNKAKSHNDSYNTDSVGRSDENAKIWVGGLPKWIEREEIERVYQTFGRILEVEINRAREPAFAFVTFSRYTSAERAIKETNQESLFGQKFIKVSWPTHQSKQDEKDMNQSESWRGDAGGRKDDNSRIWIGGLPKKIEEAEIESVYRKFGRVVEVELVQARGDLNFAFVTFSRYSAAACAIEETNQESLFGQRYIKVSWPQS